MEAILPGPVSSRPAVWYAWIFVGGLAAVVKVTERWDTSRRDRRLELALGASVLAWVLSACNACGATAAVYTAGQLDFGPFEGTHQP